MNASSAWHVVAELALDHAGEGDGLVVTLAALNTLAAKAGLKKQADYTARRLADLRAFDARQQEFTNFIKGGGQE